MLYAARLTPERLAAELAIRGQRMVEKQRAAMEDLSELEDRVKGILSGEDVCTVTYVWYHDFARECYRLQRRFGGGLGLKYEVDLLVHKWTGRGAVESVLEKVRFEALGLADTK